LFSAGVPCGGFSGGGFLDAGAQRYETNAFHDTLKSRGWITFDSVCPETPQHPACAEYITLLSFLKIRSCIPPGLLLMPVVCGFMPVYHVFCRRTA
jgi:hypothetical protein